MSSQDSLTTTVLHAVQNLSSVQKADFLLQTALSMIENGRYVCLLSASGSYEYLIYLSCITGMARRSNGTLKCSCQLLELAKKKYQKRFWPEGRLDA